MANPVVTAGILIEANGAALNNSGDPIERARTDNTVSVKAIRIGRLRYPYISGQAWRRWWRETLYEDFGWKPSPVTREAKSAYTEGDPVKYADDDLFGFMAARKRVKGESGAETQKRIAPLKNSLLVSVLPNTIEQDFAHFSRNLPVDNPDPVPFEFEHYTTYMQGAFSLSLTDTGRFEIGKMRDLPEGYAGDGSVNISEETGVNIATLQSSERRERVAQCVEALARLRHGANLTRNLSDVTPVAVIVGFLDGGNAPFQRIFRASEDGAQASLDIERLKTLLADYSERLLRVDSEVKVGEKTYAVESPVLFGCIPGILENEDEVFDLQGIQHAGSPANAIRIASALIRNGNWLSSVWG